MQDVFSHWLLALSNIHLRFLHVVPWLHIILMVVIFERERT